MASSLVSLSNALASLVESSAAPVVAVRGRPRFHSSGVHWSPGVTVTAEHTLRYDDDIDLCHSRSQFADYSIGR